MLSFRLPSLAIGCSLLMLPVTTVATSVATAVILSQTVLAQTQNHSESTRVVKKIDEIAQQITVRIDSKNHGNGSAVIIAKEGNTYSILTAAHVVKEQDEYWIVTPDKQQYRVQPNAITILEGVDLAVLQFRSDTTYTVANLANYSLDINKMPVVFVSGFPATKAETPKRLLTAGELASQRLETIVVKESSSLTNGYEMVYSNLSYRGMSGGPILDRLGRVVGINAAAEDEIEVDRAGEIVYLHLGFSLGVPIRTFLSLASKTDIKTEALKIETSIPPDFSESEKTAITNQLETLEELPEDALDWLNWGNQLLRSDRKEEALAAFDQAIQLEPNFYLAYYARGWTKMLQKESQPALADFEQVIKLRPDFSPVWRWRGMIFLNLEQYPEALASIDRGIAINPKDFTLYQLRGSVLIVMKRYEEAISAFNEVLKLNPSSKSYTYNVRGYTYLFLKEDQLAIADFSKAIELQPDFALAYYNRAVANLNKVYNRALADLDVVQNYREAIANSLKVSPEIPEVIADLTKAIELQPDYVQAYLQRAQIYEELKDYQKAIANYTEAIERVPNDVVLYQRRAQIYRLYLKDYRKAIADYSSAIELQPNTPARYIVRAETYLALKYYQRAFADYTQAIEIEPNNSNHYISRAKAYLALKDYQKAFADYTKAIEIEPSGFNYFRRGDAYREIQNYQKAIADYTKAIELRPKDAEAYNGRGLAYFLFKEYQQAIADYNQAIELQPDFATAYNNRGAAYKELKDYQKAIPDLNKAIELKPDLPNPYSHRGFVYLQLKDYPKALIDFNKAISLKSDYADAYYNRGLYYQELKETQLAIADLQTASLLYKEQDNPEGEKEVNQILQELSNKRCMMKKNL